MLKPDERKAVHAHLDELQPRIKALKQRLNELNDQKEKQFQQRSTARHEISRIVATIQRLKQERDQHTEDVKKLKDNRTGLNEIIKKKIDEAKKLNSEKRKTASKLGLKENPSHIKALMDKLDNRIETEVISFEREKELMKEIKELKKRYEAAKQASDIWDTAHQMSKDIDALREQSDAIHRQLQQKAKLSQEKHELLIEEVKKLDALKSKSDVFAHEGGTKKEEMTKLSEELGTLLKEASELNSKLFAERKEQEAAWKQERAKTFAEKLAVVKAKMAKGGKLTTEDIIVMQGEK